MEKTEFYEKLAEEIRGRVPEGTAVKVNEIWKNNGIRQTGISILPEGTAVAPTIYLDAFYERYEKGEDMDAIAGKFMQIYEKGKLKNGVDASFFTDFEKVRERIVFKLVSSRLNQKLLEEIPHKPFMDLEMVFYYLWDKRELDNATVLIKNSHLEMWGVTTETLVRTAKQNSQKLLPYELIRLDQLVGLGKMGESDMWTDLPDVNMYVLTNNARLFGAASLLYDNAVREFAFTYGKNVFIIPSSVHEVMLIPDDGAVDAECLNDMVREVNASQLDPKEVLSDHVYYYDYKDDILTACVV